MSSPLFTRRRIWQCALLSVAAAVALAFLLPADLFLSASGADIGQFAAWRAFASDSILAGHLPLWNPYTYSGQPFLGDFLSAELYPPNVIFLFLPVARAINLSYFLHLLILGWGVGVWSARRGARPLAAVLAGFVIMFSGPVFLRFYSGHLGNLCSMAWVPWMFCALEAAWRGPALRPILLAAGAVALQILGGYPQYVFDAALAAGLQAVVYSAMDPAVRRRALPVLVVVYLAGAALAAAQLLPGLAAAAESVRADKLDFKVVSQFSFPPENFLTLLAPGFFGNLTSAVYWGRCYLWEVCPFIGVTGVVLAALALGDRMHRRWARADLLVVLGLLVLALGAHTPLLRVLYDYAPEFGKFRTQAKFIFPAVVFVMPMMAAGADALMGGRLGPKRFAGGLLALGAATGAVGIILWAAPAQIAGLLAFINGTRESYLPETQMADTTFIRVSGVQAGQSLVWAGGLLAVAGLALLLARGREGWRWLPLAMLPLEMVVFAHANFATSHLGDLVQAPVAKYISGHPGDYRVLNPERANSGYFEGVPDMWGNDPTLLKRYSEFITFSQGGNPDHAGQYANFSLLPRAFALVRFKYAFTPNPAKAGTYSLNYSESPLPRALLMSNYRVLPGRDAIFAELLKADFDPAKTVYLESEPNPKPQPGAPLGTVNLLDLTSDSLTFEADTPAPTLLLITDLYSRDWRARALEGSSQTSYEVLPADYIVRAIPLGAGHHHLVVEYAPPSFRQGLMIGAAAWMVWVALGVWAMRRTQPTVGLRQNAEAG